MTLDQVVNLIVLPILALAVLLTVIRLFIGPSLPDRAVALDMLAIVGIGIVSALSITFALDVFFDIAIVIAMVSFMTTIAFAAYLEKRAKMEHEREEKS